MSPLSTSLITLACVSGGILLGTLLRTAVPKHHLRDDSKEVLELGIGLIATLTALVLGLLVSSAKSSFDSMNAALTQNSARFIMLHRVMSQYGPQTAQARTTLRRTVVGVLARDWPDEKTDAAGIEPIEPVAGLDDIHNQLIALDPQDNVQRSAQSQALQLAADMVQSRWQIVEQAQSPLPPVFLVMVVCWLTILFAGFALLTPRNVTVIAVLLACAISASGAILLITEMNHPFGGIIQLSSAPLRYALAHLQ